VCFFSQEIILPETVYYIGDGAFSCWMAELKRVVFKGKEYIQNYEYSNTAFDVTENFAIYGYTGSTAHDYATKNNIKFVSLDPLKGDMSGDGVVNINDVTDIQALITEADELTEEQIRLADVDGDGIVCVRDATQIQKYLAGVVDTL